jgi:hypothetical protein
MLSFVIFAICSYSLSSIIVEQKVFEGIRNKLTGCPCDGVGFVRRKLCQLIRCMFCTGFWSGVILICVGFNLFGIGEADPFLGGLFGAFSSYTIHLFMGLLRYRCEQLGLDT